MSFPKTQGKVNENKCFLQEIVSLVEKTKDNLPAEIKIKKGNYRLILDSDNYMLSLSFRKRLDIRIIVNKPDENILTVNKLANSIINYVNAVLKEKVASSNISVSKICSQEKPVNLPSKIIGSAQLAKANEITKENLNPISVALEYKKDNRNCLISSYYSKITETSENAAFHSLKLAEPMPFDILQKEYESLNYSFQLLDKLNEGEL